MTDPNGPAGPIHTFPFCPAPAGQHPPLPGTLWSVSVWDGTRPLAIIPLEIVEDIGQQITFRGAGVGVASGTGIIRTARFHAPDGREYGPVPCCLSSEAKKYPAALTWPNVVVVPNNQLGMGSVVLRWVTGDA
jgi:hypothetical protein